MHDQRPRVEPITSTQRSDTALRLAPSAVGEDAKDASLAGQFETYLGVAGHDALITHIKKVWASLYNARAIQYRARNDEGRHGRMAVVVLELVNARAAGVAFSADPLTGKRDRIIIEGNCGVGESVVQGVVTPDRAIVDKSDLRVLDVAVTEKVIVSVFDAAQGLIVEVPTPDLFRHGRVLNDEEIKAIALAVRSVWHQGMTYSFDYVIVGRGSSGATLAARHASCHFDPAWADLVVKASKAELAVYMDCAKGSCRAAGFCSARQVSGRLVCDQRDDLHPWSGCGL